VGSGREVHGKENPRKLYVEGLRTEPTSLVRGSSRRITIMRLRPANIRVINRRENPSRPRSTLPPKKGKEEKRKQLLVVDRSFHIRVMKTVRFLTTARLSILPPTVAQVILCACAKLLPLSLHPPPPCSGLGSDADGCPGLFVLYPLSTRRPARIAK